MIETVSSYNSFYFLLFAFLIILAIIAGSVIKHKSSDKKDTAIFYKSNDNAKDVTIHVTDNMKDMHSEVVKAEFTEQHEHELHHIETTLKEISDNLTLLTARVLKLEQERKQRE